MPSCVAQTYKITTLKYFKGVLLSRPLVSSTYCFAIHSPFRCTVLSTFFSAVAAPFGRRQCNYRIQSSIKALPAYRQRILSPYILLPLNLTSTYNIMIVVAQAATWIGGYWSSNCLLTCNKLRLIELSLDLVSAPYRSFHYIISGAWLVATNISNFLPIEVCTSYLVVHRATKEPLAAVVPPLPPLHLFLLFSSFSFSLFF